MAAIEPARAMTASDAAPARPAMSSPPTTSGSRERRTVLIGATIVVVALLLTYVLLPFARHWRERELALATTRADIAVLASLATHAGALDSAATAMEQALASGGRRVIRARSASLAASALQSFLQDASDASRLVVTRLDVAGPAPVASFGGGAPVSESDSANGANGASGATAGGSYIPATLSAYCDITGLADLLAQFARGPRVILVDRLTVQNNSALRGAPDMLQVTLTLRAPVSIE